MKVFIFFNWVFREISLDVMLYRVNVIIYNIRGNDIMLIGVRVYMLFFFVRMLISVR